MVKSDLREKEDDGVAPTTKENKESIDDEIFNIVSLIVQWYLVLDQIRYERASEAYFTDSRPKCQCAKARDIVEKCTSAKHDLSLILEVCKAIFHYSRDMIIINFIRVRLRISDVIHKILSQD